MKFQQKEVEVVHQNLELQVEKNHRLSQKYVFCFFIINLLIYIKTILFQSKTGKRGRPKKSDKKEKEESAEEEDSKEENEDEDDE